MTLLAAVALAAACALVWSGAATAQQPEAPGWAQPAEETPQSPSPGGNDDQGAAADDEPFPLVQVVLALALLSLAVLHGVGVLARRSGFSESLRDRISAVRSGPPVAARRPAFAGRSSPAGAAARDAAPRPKPAPPAAGGEERADVPVEPAAVVAKHDDVAGKPGTTPPPKPKPMAVPPKPTAARPKPTVAPPKPVAQKPQPARPATSAPGGGELADVPAKPAAVVQKHDDGAAKPAELPPKPKAPPPPPPRKPAAQKPPPAKPARPAKPEQHAKPVRPAKPEPPAKPPQAGKPRPAAKPTSATKPAPAVKRPKPIKPARKPPAPKKPRAERQPRSEPPPPPPVAPPEERDGVLTCSIYWWRDGPVADFYALATGRQGRAWVVERSPRFEWVTGDSLAEAREAHAALVEALVTAGWRHAGTEGVWYRQRFERPFAESS